MDASNPMSGALPASVSRRKFLFTALSLASLAAIDPWSVVRAADDDAGLDIFMKVSGVVSAKATDTVTGKALYQALRHVNQHFDAYLGLLAKQTDAKPGLTVDTLAENLDRAKQTELRHTLNSVVSAWYLGVVGFTTYAYQDALMFAVVDDVLCPPSYVRGAPLYWAHSNHLPFD